MPNLQAIAHALIDGKRDMVMELCRQAVQQGVAPERILSEGLIAGMDVVGKRFKADRMFVPEVLIAARAMKGGMEVLQPCLEAAGVEPHGTVVLGTVRGDLHDIGKNLVAMLLSGSGFRVVDLGTDVDAGAFVETCRNEDAQICGMSALLTTTMPQMREITQRLRESRLDVKVMIGGAPVTQHYADEIGADAFAPDGASAVDAARSLLAMV